MTCNYDANLPIETFLKKIEDKVNYVQHTNTPIFLIKIVNRSFNLILNMVIFAEDCKERKRRPLSDRTWAHLKVFFATAHQEWRDIQANLADVVFSANNMEAHVETANAISELSVDNADDCATMV